MKPLVSSLDKHFESLRDPRRGHRRIYPLKTFLILAVLATVCGCNDWVAIAEFCRLRREWLSTLIDVSAGIPSHDTFRYVFAALPSLAGRRHNNGLGFGFKGNQNMQPE